MLIIILTLAQLLGLSIVSPWAFSHCGPQLDNAKSRTNIPPISSPGNCAQCFLWWSPIQLLTLLSDNSTHWAAVMLYKNVVSRTQSAPSSPSQLACWTENQFYTQAHSRQLSCVSNCQTVQDSEYYQKEQSPTDTLQRPRGQLSLSNLGSGKPPWLGV